MTEPIADAEDADRRHRVLPLAGVVLPDGGGWVSIVAHPGAPVHAVADGVLVPDPSADGRWRLEARDGCIWTLGGLVVVVAAGSDVRAGQQIGRLADQGPSMTGGSLTVRATDSAGGPVDVAAALAGLPDPASIATPDGLGPDPAR